MDLPTGLVFVLSAYAFERFAATGAWKWWAALALAVGAAFLTRFSAIQLAPILILLYLAGLATGQITRRARVAAGILVLPLTSLLALHAGYLGQTTFEPLSTYAFRSPGFRALREAHPGLRPPLPDAYVGGLDYLLSLAQTDKPSYLLGTIRSGHTWYYFPLAIAFKWPLAFFALLAARLAALRRARRDREGWWRQALLLVPVGVVLGSAMTAHLEFGVRYLFPILPFLCVWLGAGLAEQEAGAPAGTSAAPGRSRAARASAAPVAGAGPRREAARIAIGLVLVLAIETATCAPWYLSFFNLPSGGPGGGDRLVNDSNVDWGQGLIALAGMKRRDRPHPPLLSRHHRSRDLRDRLPAVSRRPDRARERMDGGEQLLPRRASGADDDAGGGLRVRALRLPEAARSACGRAPGALHVPVSTLPPRRRLTLQPRAGPASHNRRCAPHPPSKGPAATDWPPSSQGLTMRWPSVARLAASVARPGRRTAPAQPAGPARVGAGGGVAWMETAWPAEAAESQ
jgi:hypothetical protein